MEDDIVERFNKLKDIDIMEKCSIEKIKIIMRYSLLGLVAVILSVLIWYGKMSSNDFIVGFIIGAIIANVPRN